MISQQPLSLNLPLQRSPTLTMKTFFPHPIKNILNAKLHCFKRSHRVTKLHQSIKILKMFLA